METLENQSWTQDENSPSPDTVGRGRAYGVPNFNELSPEEKNVVLGAYKNALERGWQIPEAEGIAREALERFLLQSAQLPPEPVSQQEAAQEDTPSEEPEATSTMPKFAKFAFLIAGLCAVAYFILQGVLGPATPLQAAITARSKAAVTLADATAKANAANAALSIAKARYEVAYKREACFISGSVNCK